MFCSYDFPYPRKFIDHRWWWVICFTDVSNMLYKVSTLRSLLCFSLVLSTNKILHQLPVDLHIPALLWTLSQISLFIASLSDQLLQNKAENAPQNHLRTSPIFKSPPTAENPASLQAGPLFSCPFDSLISLIQNQYLQARIIVAFTLQGEVKFISSIMVFSESF